MITERAIVLRAASDLGFALAEIRGDRARTQAQVAQSVGMDRTQLAHLEAGRTGRFLENVLVLLAELGAEVTIRWSISDPDLEETTTVTAALPAPPTTPRLEPLGGNRVVPPSINDAATPRVEPLIRLGEQFRRQQEAMERALAPMRRQAEAMERALASAQGQAEVMEHAPAPARGQAEVMEHAPAPARDSMASAGDQFRDQLEATSRAGQPSQPHDAEDGDTLVDRNDSPS